MPAFDLVSEDELAALVAEHGLTAAVSGLRRAASRSVGVDVLVRLDAPSRMANASPLAL